MQRPSFLASAVLVVCALAITGCGKADRAAPASTVAATTPAMGAPAGGVPVPSADRAMRITIDTTVLVAHRDAAVASLRAATAAVGGYVSEGNLYGDDDGGSAKLTVKVPVAKLGGFRSTVAELGKVTSDSEKAEDVTEARADVKARLHNRRAEEARLLDLLANHTGALGDVVLVEKELATVREAIERMEAEERTLEGQIAFATVNVTLDTVYVPHDPSVGSRLAEAAVDGLHTAKAFSIGSVVVLFSAGPTMLLAGVGLYLLWRAFAWVRAKRRAKG